MLAIAIDMKARCQKDLKQMNDQNKITIFRIYNTSGEELDFETHQGFDVTLSPGSGIDLYSHELEGSESFAKIDNPDKLRKLAVQEFSCSADLLDQLNNMLSEYRGLAPAQADNEAIKVKKLATEVPANETVTKTNGGGKLKKPRNNPEIKS